VIAPHVPLLLLPRLLLCSDPPSAACHPGTRGAGSDSAGDQYYDRSSSNASISSVLPNHRDFIRPYRFRAALSVLKTHGFQRSILLSPRRPPLDCSNRESVGHAHYCRGIFELTPMQAPRPHVCYAATSGLLLKPLSVSHIITAEHDALDGNSHMSCGVWANPAAIVPVDDSVVSFTSVDAVVAAAGSEKGRFPKDLCQAWQRLSESSLWISSWTDFPKAAKEICYSIMSVCDRNSQ
jgi:hypothetical protein